MKIDNGTFSTVTGNIAQAMDPNGIMHERFNNVVYSGNMPNDGTNPTDVNVISGNPWICPADLE